jgi:hypothetical protein
MPFSIDDTLKEVQNLITDINNKLVYVTEKADFNMLMKELKALQEINKQLLIMKSLQLK